MHRVAFITGVSGQDGSYLAELLLEKGYVVHGFVRRSSNHKNLSRISEVVGNAAFFTHVGDMTDSASIQNVLTEIWSSAKETAEVFELYNLAAQSHVGQSFSMPEFTAKVDGLGPLSILEWIKTQSQDDRRRIRFYQASTSELFGKVVEVPQNELTPFYPRSPYAIAKLYAYWMVRNYRESYGIYAVNGILFNHESPRRGDDFVTRKITLALRDIGIKKRETMEMGNIDVLRDWGHARDYVEGMWRILQAPVAEDFVLGTGEQHSVREFIQLAWRYAFQEELTWVGVGLEEKGLDSEGRVRVSIDPQFFRPSEVQTLLADPRKAWEKLGWRATTPFEKLVEEMVASDLA
jgi:GDPmannose 4,6-dehydratase